MIVFAAGNKYQCIELHIKNDNWYVYGRKMIKSTGKLSRLAQMYNVGPIKPVEINEEA